MINLLQGRLEFYRDTENILGEEIIKMELKEIEKGNNQDDFKVLFNKCYSKPGKANFFKKSNYSLFKLVDRFYHKYYIMTLLILIIVIYLAEFIYTTIRIIYYEQIDEQISKMLSDYKIFMK